LKIIFLSRLAIWKMHFVKNNFKLLFIKIYVRAFSPYLSQMIFINIYFDGKYSLTNDATYIGYVN